MKILSYEKKILWYRAIYLINPWALHLSEAFQGSSLKIGWQFILLSSILNSPVIILKEIFNAGYFIR